jgi:hypothetical protein
MWKIIYKKGGYVETGIDSILRFIDAHNAECGIGDKLKYSIAELIEIDSRFNGAVDMVKAELINTTDKARVKVAKNVINQLKYQVSAVHNTHPVSLDIDKLGGDEALQDVLKVLNECEALISNVTYNEVLSVHREFNTLIHLIQATYEAPPLLKALFDVDVEDYPRDNIVHHNIEAITKSSILSLISTLEA